MVSSDSKLPSSLNATPVSATSQSPQLPLKVVLIEDSLLVQRSLGALLGELPQVEVVGAAVDERSALEMLQRQQPHLAIVDLQLREGSGLGVLRVLARHPDRFGCLRAVVFSSHGQSVIREHCLALGVEQFFDKATQTSDLLAYVQAQAAPS